GHGAHEHGPGAQLRDGYHAGARSSRGHHGRGHRLLRRGVPLYRRAATQVRRAARARYADCRRRNRGGGDRHGCERIEAGRGDPVRDYIYPAFDQVVSELARLRYRTAGEYSAAVTIRTPCGGGIRGGQTHSQSPEGIFTHVCGIKVVMPSNPYDAKGLLISSIEDEDPVVFFEPKRLYNGPFDGDPHKPAVPWSTHPKGAVPDGYYKVPLSKAEVVRPGRTSPCWPTARWCTWLRQPSGWLKSMRRSSMCARSRPSIPTRSALPSARPAAVSSCTRRRASAASARSSRRPCRRSASGIWRRPSPVSPAGIRPIRTPSSGNTSRGRRASPRRSPA